MTGSVNQDHKSYGSFEDREERHSFGDIFLREIKFKKVQTRLENMISLRLERSDIRRELDLDDDELTVFSKRVKPRTDGVESVVVEMSENREVDLEEFLSTTTGDIDIIGWESYYSILHFANSELKVTRHSKSGFGILLLPGDLVKLLRFSFGRMYSKQVVKYIRENRINVFQITNKMVESNKGKKTIYDINGSPVGVCWNGGVIRYKNVKLLDDSFKFLIDKFKMENKNLMKSIAV
jgi:hypothetical protein